METESRFFQAGDLPEEEVFMSTFLWLDNILKGSTDMSCRVGITTEETDDASRIFKMQFLTGELPFCEVNSRLKQDADWSVVYRELSESAIRLFVKHSTAVMAIGVRKGAKPNKNKYQA